MPIPLSCTIVSIVQTSPLSPGSSRKEMSMVPPLGVYFMELPTMFKNIWE